MTQILISGLIAFAAFALLMQLVSVVAILPRFRKKHLALVTHPALTVLRPVCGMEPGMDLTLASSFGPQDGVYEVIFCVANPADPAIPTIRAVMARFPQTPSRLLIGEDWISGNPKLNNLAKGWVAASHDRVAMIDSNVLLPRTYIQTLFQHWTPGTGLVTSPPVGIHPVGVWASVEAGFLNTYQDRWQLFSDQIGNGFAQGKVLMLQKALLEPLGGLAALGHDLAEDVASTKVVRAAGLKVRVLSRPFAQPLGPRALAEVWARQVRWARVRRAGFPVLFAAEILSAAAVPFAVLAGLTFGGVVPLALALAYLVLWYGAELVLAYAAGWPVSAKHLGAWVLRDAMIPAVWLAAFASRGFVWRGNVMRAGDSAGLHPAE